MKQKEDPMVLEVAVKNKMVYHEDDRAQRLLNVFPLDKGQINITYINSTDHIVAWHKHEKQTDYWICLERIL